MKAISVPNNEIRKKINSLGFSQKQYIVYIMYLGQTKVLNSRVTKEIAIRNARYLFNPTSEELKQEELYLKEICAKGFPSDYQDYLSSTPFFSKVDDFLALGSS